MKRREGNRENYPKQSRIEWDDSTADCSSVDYEDTELLGATRNVWSNILGLDISSRLASEILTGFDSLVDFLQTHVDMEDAERCNSRGPIKNVHETL